MIVRILSWLGLVKSILKFIVIVMLSYFGLKYYFEGFFAFCFLDREASFLEELQQVFLPCLKGIGILFLMMLIPKDKIAVDETYEK